MPTLVSVPWIDQATSEGSGYRRPRSDSKGSLEDRRETAEVKS
jgi:hypothetical protein